MKIERTLFWFKDGDELLTDLNDRFFSLGILLNRLLNEAYDGRKIKFINIDFSTEKTYELHPNVPRDNAHYYGGHLRYFGLFERGEFTGTSIDRQRNLLWYKAHEYLMKSAKSIRNRELSEASTYALKKGLELNLNPDYKMMKSDIMVSGHVLEAAVWINFREDEMVSRLTLADDGNVIFERDIDRTKNGVEFFLEMYKSIEFNEGNLIVKGRPDAIGLPLTISIDDLLI